METRGFHNQFLVEEEEAPMDRQYVGIDFHRRRSVIVRVSRWGERLAVASGRERSVRARGGDRGAGEAPQVVIEATYGWYWAVDLLQELGAAVHLANPKALNWGERRVKNDVNDATDLADMLRLNRLAGGVDRAAGDPGAARAGALSSEARAAPQWSQGAGARGDGQRGRVAGRH